MARRSDFTQKLLDDLRMRKEKMGLLPSSSSSSVSITAAGNKNHRWQFRGSGDAAANNLNSKNVSMEASSMMWIQNRNKSPLLLGGSEQIVPYGRSRSREHNIDLSMALAMGLSNSGKLQNIEILANPTVYYQFPSLSPSQIGGEVAKGVQNINMILKACSNRFNFDRSSVEIGRELLKGAMDLEESLKMLMAIQDASDYMVGSQKKQQLKLLKGKGEEEDEELRTHRDHQWKEGRKTKFSFIRERRGGGGDEKSRHPANNSNRNSSKSSISGGGSGSKSEAPAGSHGGRRHELIMVSNNGVSSISLKENAVSEKVRIPNIIAKLMGLEELPSPAAEAKSVRSPQTKEMRNRLVEIDEVMDKKEGMIMANSSKKTSKNGGQEKGMNNLVKNNSKGSRNSDNTRPGSKDSAMEVTNMDQKREISITKQQMRGRIEQNVSGVGNSRRQIDSSTKIINSDDEQKRNLIISDVKTEKFRNKGLIIQKNELLLKQLREDSSTKTINSDHEQKKNLLVSEVKNEKFGNEGLDQKKVLILKKQREAENQSKGTEKHPKEMRVRKQFSKESVDSNKNDLANKTGSQWKKENLKIIPDGTNLRNRSAQNHHREKKWKEQSSYKRSSPLKSDIRAEHMRRTSMKATVMKKLTQIQSVQKVGIIKMREEEDTIRRSLAEVNAENISLEANQAMEQRSSILQALENRLKERKKTVGGIEEKDSDANLELEMQQKNENVSSVNLPDDNGRKKIIASEPISGEDTKAFASCSSPLVGDVNIETSMEEPIQEEINAKFENESNVYQLPERFSIAMTECEEGCYQEDSTQIYKQIQSGFTEHEKEDHNRTMQLNSSSSSKPTVNKDQTIMKLDQQKVLSEDEETLKQMLITSHNVLIAAQSLLQIQIPVNILQKTTENVSPNKDAGLFIDCSYELLRRKNKREVLSFYRKGSLATSERRRRCNIDVLIKEVNADIKSLMYRNCAEGSDYGLADWLNGMIEKDVQNGRPDVNCLWDFGWDYNRFGCLESDEMVRDVEEYVLNGLLYELSRDLLNVSISIL